MLRTHFGFLYHDLVCGDVNWGAAVAALDVHAEFRRWFYVFVVSYVVCHLRVGVCTVIRSTPSHPALAVARADAKRNRTFRGRLAAI